MNWPTIRNFGFQNMVRSMLRRRVHLATGFICLTLFAPQAMAQVPRCSITSIDTATGTVAAKVSSSGQAFQFTVSDATLLHSLKIGQAVFANFKTGQVSLDGKRACCTITTSPATGAHGPIPNTPGPPPQASTPQQSATPSQGTGGGPKTATGPVGGPAARQTPGGQTKTVPACCQVTSVNTAAGTATAKVNATGQTFEFKTSPQQLSVIKVGQSIFANLKSRQVSLNGTQACCIITGVGQAGQNVGTGQTIQTLGKGIIQNIGKVNLIRCCQLLNPTQVIGPGATGPPMFYASVTGTNSNIGFYVFPTGPSGSYCVSPQSAIGTPIWADLSNNLISADGATPCGWIFQSVETVYLDVVPVGVIYVPPGDPKATGGFVPQQQFTSTNSIQNTTTTTTAVISGQAIKLNFSGPWSINYSQGQQTQTTNTQQVQNQLSFLSGQTANGAAGYPGRNDVIVFFVNPTYDVTYLTGYGPSGPIPGTRPQIVSNGISPHTVQPGEPGPQWLLVAATVTEISNQSGNGAFLNNILTSPPAAPVPVGTSSTGTLGGGPRQLPARSKPLTALQTVVQNLLQLDPMLTAPAAAPSYVLTHPERFTPIVSFQDDAGAQYGPGPQGWTYCQVPGPIPFAATNALTKTTTTQTQSKFTSGVSMTLDPTKFLTAVGLPTPSLPGGAGASVQFDNTWELDTTVQYSSSNQFSLATKGNFGSGTAPYDANTGCPTGLPKFETTLYYDWQYSTVLFWTQQVN